MNVCRTDANQISVVSPGTERVLIPPVGSPLFFSVTGAVGAALRVGRALDQPVHVCGDSLLLDFRHSFFAVADSSGRSPHAAQAFLTKFAMMMDGLPFFQSGQHWTEKDVPVIAAEVKKQADELLGTIPFFESSSFTGLAVLQTTAGHKGIVLHTGDSLLMKYSGASDVDQISQTNFWMTGRSTELYQVDIVDAAEGQLFFLATDGLSDLVFPEHHGRGRYLARILATVSVENVPRRLLEDHDQRQSVVDDLAVLVLDPIQLPHREETIIISPSGNRSLFGRKRENPGKTHQFDSLDELKHRRSIGVTRDR